MIRNPIHQRNSDPPTICSVSRATERGEITEWFVRLPGGLLVSCGCHEADPREGGNDTSSREVADWLISCIEEWRR